MAQADGEFDYDDDGFQPASQADYEAETADTTVIDLQEGPGSFRVRTIPPLRVLRNAETYGVSALFGGGGQDVNLGDLGESADLGGFIEETIVPNVVEPTVYWTEPDDPEAKAAHFDLTTLEPNDLIQVVTGLTGVSREELNQQLDDRFRG